MICLEIRSKQYTIVKYAWTVRSTLFVIAQVENMRASRPEDVQQILAKIPDKKLFNEKLQELIFGQLGLLAAWKMADVLQHMEDLSYILKWAKLSERVENGTLIWRSWTYGGSQK